ncbi:MAG: hypothetical protein HKM96_13965, partial [Boseongicola sp.]|nr:hypothetical protein [Boseongicola sp.]
APVALDQVMLGMSDGYGVRLQIELAASDDSSNAIEEDHTERNSGDPVGPNSIPEPVTKG